MNSIDFKFNKLIQNFLKKDISLIRLEITKFFILLMIGIIYYIGVSTEKVMESLTHLGKLNITVPAALYYFSNPLSRIISKIPNNMKSTIPAGAVKLIIIMFSIFMISVFSPIIAIIGIILRIKFVYDRYENIK